MRETGAVWSVRALVGLGHSSQLRKTPCFDSGKGCISWAREVLPAFLNSISQAGTLVNVRRRAVQHAVPGARENCHGHLLDLGRRSFSEIEVAMLK